MPDEDLLLDTLKEKMAEVCSRVEAYAPFCYMAEVAPASYSEGMLNPRGSIQPGISRASSDLEKSTRHPSVQVLWDVVGYQGQFNLISPEPDSPIFFQASHGIWPPETSSKTSPEEILEAEPAVKKFLRYSDGIITEIRNNPNG